MTHTHVLMELLHYRLSSVLTLLLQQHAARTVEHEIVCCCMWLPVFDVRGCDT